MKTMKNKILVLALAAMPFAGNSQEMNLNFENWENPITEEMFDNRPVGWMVQNTPSVEPNDFGMLYHSPVTDAQNGSYALKLSTWYYYTKDMALLTQPYTSRLSSLKGYYIYEENEVEDQVDTIIDIAQVSVFMTKWNANTMHRDTVGMGVLDLNAVADYTLFTNNITYINSTVVPDSIRILIDPSLVRRDPAGPNYMSMDDGKSSFFTVDNLFLTDEGVAGVNEFSQTLDVFPNPATDMVFVENFNGYATLSDLNGKLIREQELENSEAFSLDKLDAGIYMLQLRNNTTIQNVRIVKK
ncbi:MAG: Secretion system C-terminal sorting domain [Fluviicola sp.]|jgi:hypothetical protein|uniref:T9SS type A sorting domain-containing protein n=1 Tax=Fluviicola sp. TaxID=1917219 RepID=UPI00262904A2|nr:T9SS type A sorting domain-containing protein [Fluviicola sp.]MDF3026073.1 Secretion system C-terminal sorting domain [Fluviicola sp.]